MGLLGYRGLFRKEPKFYTSQNENSAAQEPFLFSAVAATTNATTSATLFTVPAGEVYHIAGATLCLDMDSSEVGTILCIAQAWIAYTTTYPATKAFLTLYRTVTEPNTTALTNTIVFNPPLRLKEAQTLLLNLRISGGTANSRNAVFGSVNGFSQKGRSPTLP